MFAEFWIAFIDVLHCSYLSLSNSSSSWYEVPVWIKSWLSFWGFLRETGTRGFESYLKKLSFAYIFYSPQKETSPMMFWKGIYIPWVCSSSIIWDTLPYFLESFWWWLLHCIMFLVCTVWLIYLKISHKWPVSFPSIAFLLEDKNSP